MVVAMAVVVAQPCPRCLLGRCSQHGVALMGGAEVGVVVVVAMETVAEGLLPRGLMTRALQRAPLLRPSCTTGKSCEMRC